MYVPAEEIDGQISIATNTSILASGAQGPFLDGNPRWSGDFLCHGIYYFRMHSFFETWDGTCDGELTAGSLINRSMRPS